MTNMIIFIEWLNLRYIRCRIEIILTQNTAVRVFHFSNAHSDSPKNIFLFLVFTKIGNYSLTFIIINRTWENVNFITHFMPNGALEYSFRF